MRIPLRYFINFAIFCTEPIIPASEDWNDIMVCDADGNLSFGQQLPRQPYLHSCIINDIAGIERFTIIGNSYRFKFKTVSMLRRTKARKKIGSRLNTVRILVKLKPNRR